MVALADVMSRVAITITTATITITATSPSSSALGHSAAKWWIYWISSQLLGISLPWWRWSYSLPALAWDAKQSNSLLSLSLSFSQLSFSPSLLHAPADIFSVAAAAAAAAVVVVVACVFVVLDWWLNLLIIMITISGAAAALLPLPTVRSTFFAGRWLVA